MDDGVVVFVELPQRKKWSKFAVSSSLLFFTF
jgi:hypothetical protein